jgi:hypothetical protein
MYCRKCGKYIEYDSLECRECEAKANEIHNVVSNVYHQEMGYQMPLKERNNQANSTPSPRMLGFKGALMSAILPAISMILSVSALFFFLAQTPKNTEGKFIYESGVELLCVRSIIFQVVALAISIVAIVLSTKAIRLVGRVVKEGGVRPIATQVLGIVGRVVGICMTVVVVIYLFSQIALTGIVCNAPPM